MIAGSDDHPSEKEVQTAVLHFGHSADFNCFSRAVWQKSGGLGLGRTLAKAEESKAVRLLGSLRQAWTAYRTSTVASAGAVHSPNLAGAQRCALGVELHLFYRGFHVPLLSALTHNTPQDEEN